LDSQEVMSLFGPPCMEEVDQDWSSVNQATQTAETLEMALILICFIIITKVCLQKNKPTTFQHSVSHQTAAKSMIQRTVAVSVLQGVIKVKRLRQRYYRGIRWNSLL